MNETLAEATLAADRCMAAEKIVDALIGKGFVQPDDRIPVKHAVIDIFRSNSRSNNQLDGVSDR